MQEDKPVQKKNYSVELDNFEGPLDLLVYLIQQNEMEIFTVSLAKIAEDYLAFISQIPSVDLDQGGEFLVLAATLILFKARQLLPTPPEELDEEIFDPFAEQKRLAEFERFRRVAELLKEYEVKWSSVHGRKGKVEKGEVVWELEEVSVFDLYQAFQRILTEIGSGKPAVVFGEDYTVDEKMVELRMLLTEVEMFSLSEYLRQMRSKSEIIVTFLALLEMVRQQRLAVKQNKIYAEIWIVRGEFFATEEEMEE